jgi:carotenoid 1,2-hydratase
VALNVALYGPRARRWTMTERGEADLAQAPDSLVIGPSRVTWDGNALAFEIDEAGAVFGERVKGRVTIRPEALVTASFALDSDSRHRWAPIATRARVELAFDRPALSWSGDAYLDSNFGDEPMEARFRHWQWSRAHVPGGTRVFYEGTRRDDSRFALSLLIDRDGRPHAAEAPPEVRLRPTGWLMPRATRSEGRARVLKTWEDAPFYSRSTLATHLEGGMALAVHESLSLTRFAQPIVQAMLPYRMPRKA